MDIHIYHHFDTDTTCEKKLDQILQLLQDVQRKEVAMSIELDALTVQVKANEDVEQSAITLLQGLSGQIAALKTDPAALQALSDSLNASANSLAQAIVANTPAA